MISLLTPLPQIIVRFVEMKEWLLGLFGLTQDAMHVHVGLAIFFSLWLALRRYAGGRGGWWLPFGLLAVLSVVAEVFDIVSLLSVESTFDPWESVKDVVNTLAWPLALSVLFTWQGIRFSRD